MQKKNGRELINYLIETTRNRETDIESVLQGPMSSGLRQELRNHEASLQTLRSKAEGILEEKAWTVRNGGSLGRAWSRISGPTRAMGKDCDSKVAAHFIRGSTRDVIRGLRQLHAYSGSEGAVSNLMRDLVACETDQIEKLESYL